MEASSTCSHIDREPDPKESTPLLPWPEADTKGTQLTSWRPLVLGPTAPTPLALAGTQKDSSPSTTSPSRACHSFVALLLGGFRASEFGASGTGGGLRFRVSDVGFGAFGFSLVKPSVEITTLGSLQINWGRRAAAVQKTLSACLRSCIQARFVLRFSLFCSTRRLVVVFILRVTGSLKLSYAFTVVGN